MSDGSRTIRQIEEDIEAARNRLAGTVDELAFRAHPKQIAKRQVTAARQAFTNATQTPDGELRMDRIAALAAIGVVLVLAGLRARRKG